jgi:hypothetical protein
MILSTHPISSPSTAQPPLNHDIARDPQLPSSNSTSVARSYLWSTPIQASLAFHLSINTKTLTIYDQSLSLPQHTCMVRWTYGHIVLACSISGRFRYYVVMFYVAMNAIFVLSTFCLIWARTRNI